MDFVQNGLFTQDDDGGISLGAYAEQAYLDYAVSVVRGRALPDVSDGQKPVQRRILFAMQAMGLASGSRPVKSARVVGDVLGKYHPHGDQAAYDAMVRMAQDFSLRYPLIDGQGNFGSRDGDNAAAMRYTEARLTPFSRLLLDELNEGTVDFAPNYDGSQQEPLLLPARLPIALLNGASGIAVGMATEIPPHNLTEVANACVALLKDDALSDEELFSIVPGPDFPGGGQIISSREELANVYRSGRGSLKVRARWTFEEMARGQWQLVITELPPGTSTQKILEEIEEKTNPKIRAGRKALTAEQQQTRALLLGLLDSVRDESGKDAPVRLVFEPKSSRISRDDFVNTLLAQTSMESNSTVNLVSIGIDGRPGQRNLRTMLDEWLQFRSHTLRRRTQYRLDKTLDRIHILEGRMVVYLDVDAVIQTIREADEPRMALMDKFQLSERQAEDILEMRLRQLARLEGFKIEQELEKQRAEQQKLRQLLDSKAAFKRMMIKEIEADTKTYGDERRTVIEEAERAVLDVKVPDEPVTIIVSNKGWLRRRQGHGVDTSTIGFKTGDGFKAAIECRSTDDVVAIGADGRVYTVAAATIPSGRGDGQPITAMADINASAPVQHVVAGPATQQYVLGTDSGYGFIAKHSDLTTRQRAGKQFLTVPKGDHVLPPLILQEGDTDLALFSKKGRFMVIELAELRQLSGGGRGTIMMGIDDGDRLAQWAAAGEAGFQLAGVYRRRDWVETLGPTEVQHYKAKRARKGKLLDTKIAKPALQRAG